MTSEETAKHVFCSRGPASGRWSSDFKLVQRLKPSYSRPCLVQSATVSCSLLQRVAVYFIVLQCGAVCFSGSLVCIYVCVCQNVPSSTELNSPDDNAELMVNSECLSDYSTRCPKVRSHMEAGHVKPSRSSFRAGGPGFTQLKILSRIHLARLWGRVFDLVRACFRPPISRARATTQNKLINEFCLIAPGYLSIFVKACLRLLS